MRIISFFLLVFFICFISGCKKEIDEPNPGDKPMVKLKLKFDQNQERLDNFGQPSPIATGNAGQSPDFRQMSIHFIELVPNDLTAYKSGAIIYQGEEIPANNPNPHQFTTAIDFENAVLVEEGELFLEIPASEIEAGTYLHLRASVSYQEYGVKFNLVNVPSINTLNNQEGILASFLGFNTYIEELKVKQDSVAINSAKLQGFWAFETQFSSPYEIYNQLYMGQAPDNATTVVNPFPNAPIPVGSCVVSGSFDQPLIISGEEKDDINITLSFSTNQSFEWKDSNNNGFWDIDAQNPENSEKVIDMGLRGLKAILE